LPIWFLTFLIVPSNIVGLVLLQASFILLGVAGFIVWRQGYRPARFYLLSWALFFVTGFLFILNGFALIPENLFSDKPLLIAVALGALLGSLALADRVNLLRAESEASRQELERSERKYHSLFDNSRDGIFIATREGQILDVNPTWLDMFGMLRSDLAQANAKDFYVDPADRVRLFQMVDERGYIQNEPVQLRRHDGSPLLGLVSLTTWQDEQTGHVRYQGVVRDITAQRRLEQELAQQQAQKEQAIADERGRLARELHDSVTQSLYSIGLYANAAERAVATGKKKVGLDHIRQIIELGLEAMVDMRSLIFELRPPVLERVGLAEALQLRLQAVEGRAGAAIEFHTNGGDGLSLPVQMELYRVAQEALGNVVKHAHAKHIAVNLLYEPDHAVLEIRDDGDGFDLERAQQNNTMGLRSIAERTQKIKGVLTVESTPGRGTLVHVEVPYG
jgi:PAS domain S-box-containing protein